MDVFDAINNRASVRTFKNLSVSREDVNALIDAGRRAPSGRNVQPWEFVVITDEEMRVKIADITNYGKFIAQAPVCIAVYCEDTKYYLEDGCAAVQNILLAATGLGLGACWVAGDKKPYTGEINSLLNVPVVYNLVALIAVGHPDSPVKIKEKKSLKNVLHWEKFRR